MTENMTATEPIITDPEPIQKEDLAFMEKRYVAFTEQLTYLAAIQDAAARYRRVIQALKGENAGPGRPPGRPKGSSNGSSNESSNGSGLTRKDQIIKMLSRAPGGLSTRAIHAELKDGAAVVSVGATLNQMKNKGLIANTRVNGSNQSRWTIANSTPKTTTQNAAIPISLGVVLEALVAFPAGARAADVRDHMKLTGEEAKKKVPVILAYSRSKKLTKSKDGLYTITAAGKTYLAKSMEKSMAAHA